MKAEQVLQNDFINYLCDFYGNQDGMYKDDYSSKLTKPMIVEGITRLTKTDWFSKCDELTREQCKAWFAMIYPEIWSYSDCGYYIGYIYKDDWFCPHLSKIRKDAEQVWLNKLK